MEINPIRSATTPLASPTKTQPLSDDALFNQLADTTTQDGTVGISKDSFVRSKDAQQLMGNFASYDLNHDGVISKDELTGVHQFFQNFVKNIEQSMSSAFSSLGSMFSSNGSGDS